MRRLIAAPLASPTSRAAMRPSKHPCRRVVGVRLLLCLLFLAVLPNWVTAQHRFPGRQEPIVSVPGRDSPERNAIVNALRQWLQSPSSFRIDHIRIARRWAFVRATEVVALEGGERQETDLTVAALLENPSGKPATQWRIVDLWMLPDETERPLEAFVRRVRARLQAERLPHALLPDDLRAQFR